MKNIITNTFYCLLFCLAANQASSANNTVTKDYALSFGDEENEAHHVDVNLTLQREFIADEAFFTYDRGSPLDGDIAPTCEVEIRFKNIITAEFKSTSQLKLTSLLENKSADLKVYKPLAELLFDHFTNDAVYLGRESITLTGKETGDLRITIPLDEVGEKNCEKAAKLELDLKSDGDRNAAELRTSLERVRDQILLCRDSEKKEEGCKKEPDTKVMTFFGRDKDDNFFVDHGPLRNEYLPGVLAKEKGKYIFTVDAEKWREKKYSYKNDYSRLKLFMGQKSQMKAKGLMWGLQE